MNYGHMFMPTNPMRMQSSQSMSPQAPMMAQPPNPMGMPGWASQMGPQQPPMAMQPGMGPAPMGNNMAAMTPAANPIDKTVASMGASEGMTGTAAANPYAGAAMMGMNMLGQQQSKSNEVINRRREMNQQGMDRMQQIAAMMRNRMQGPE